MDSKIILEKSKTSMIWSFIEKVSVQGVSFIISLILARILMPDDYGVIAILTIFMSVASVFIDSGLSSALIQKQDRTDIDFTTAFFTNVTVATACFLLIYLTAPLIADFFGIPILKEVSRFYAIVLIIGSLSLIQKTKCYIEYNFRKLATVSLVAIFCGGAVAIYFASKGYGVWSLVYYNIVTEAIRTIGLWVISSWYPKFVFSNKSFKQICGFGYNVLMANIINVITSNFYTFVVGKLFSASNLGFYSRGQSMAYIFPSNVSNMVVQASYPLFCELQSEKERLSIVFLKYVKLTFVFVAPIMTLLFVLSKPIIILLITEKWLDSVFYIQVLAIAYAFDPVMRLNANVINVTGHSEYSLKAEIWKKIALIGLLVISCPFGIKTMTVALALYSFFDLFIVSFYVKKVINVSFCLQVKSISPIVCYALISGIICFLFLKCINSVWVQIISGILICLTLYITLIFIFSGSIFEDIKKLRSKNE